MMTFLNNNQIADFLMEHYLPCSTWNRDFIIKWYQWYHHFNLSEIIADSKNEILAIAFARPIQNPKDGLDEYHFDPMGECLFVDMVAVLDKRTKPQLLEAILKKMGSKKLIAFKRTKSSKIIRSYPFGKFMSKFIKGNK